MNAWSLELLEFDALKAVVARYVASPSGRALLDELEPSADRAALNQSLAEAAEAIAYGQESSRPQPAARGAAIRVRFDNLPDPAPHIAKLAIEGVSLEGLEIRELTVLLDRACDVRAILTAVTPRFPRLGTIASDIGEFRPLLQELSGKIDPDGRVSDSASVALSRIRREMERQKRLIEESLERFMRAHRDDGVLQDEFVAIRNDRFVVPIVSGQKRRIDGIVHAASGTGHTLFIEPMETVELNNDLVRLRDSEEREVRRILADLTGRLRGACDDIRVTVEVLARLEIAFAKAAFAADFGCVIPRFGDRLHLVAARHPLLLDVLRRQRKPVVPMSLTLEAGRRTLLISGPNTGGKTVALKTAGLLALMAQSGLPVPADSAELPVFDEVLADMGDNQSIEASLSSFSSHVARVKEILERVGPGSLVLFDELGRATDPEEGGALAVAILEHVRQSGAFTLCSTHLLAPKIHGSQTEGVLNASMSFDQETLAPTYALRTGAPGASAGLDIARRLGLPGFLIDRARASLSDAQRDLARLLRLLEERTEAAGRAESELRAQKALLEQERAKLQADWEKRDAARVRELERRAEKLVDDFRKRADQTIDRLEQNAGQRKFTERAQRVVAQASREMREEIQPVTAPESGAGVSGAGAEAAKPTLAEGARVKLRGVREPARIKRILSNGVVEVEAGFLKLQVTADDVMEVLPDTPEAAKLPRGVTVKTAPRPDHVVSVREINLIGRRAEEAMAELDKFLDTAALASVDRVRIVHGHGMGILKRAVKELLETHPLVARFQGADQFEGGAGATIAELRAG